MVNFPRVFEEVHWHKENISPSYTLNTIHMSLKRRLHFTYSLIINRHEVANSSILIGQPVVKN